jgi:DNA-3-methyladenine glycosylase I
MSPSKELPDYTVGSDGLRRCWWCGDDPQYIEYHDREWGKPAADDQQLYEKMCLEGFQAGLSWITILRKRSAFRSAFRDFKIESVAKFSSSRVEKMLLDAKIVRHRGKIESAINNAQRALELRDEFGSLAHFFWQFEPAKPKYLDHRKEMTAHRPESTALSKELKRRGWSFVGPTTCYSLMQAMGMVNDHLRECHRWKAIEQLRSEFSRP